jgi:hypothetical protein
MGYHRGDELSFGKAVKQTTRSAPLTTRLQGMSRYDSIMRWNQGCDDDAFYLFFQKQKRTIACTIGGAKRKNLPYS